METQPGLSSLAIWSLLIAAASYALLGAIMLRRSLGQQAWPKGTGLVQAAIWLTVAWALASTRAAQPGPWLALSMVADLARYGAWFALLLLLLRGDSRSAPRWMPVLAVALPLVTFAGVFLLPLGGARIAFVVGSLSLAIFGLMLVEQLLRNLPEAALWSGKPIGLALAGIFAFDLYLYSQGVLFQALDADAWNIRGLVHAAFTPLLWLASSRHRNWLDKIRVSRKVVFHSATLLLVGVYLLFIASVGYIVRYLGSDWGRALQLALIFVALIGLIALALSRSLRARLRVQLGKHFFRYRYDYREEWLKFTQSLASQNGPQELGLNVIRGLADMVESPSGALWVHRPDEPALRQVARWNLPAISATEMPDGSLSAFLRRTGWVIDLREMRERPERYEGLVLPEWLASHDQAWLVVPLWLGPDLLGFVVLGRPRAPMELNWEVTDLLKTAARQAASFLAQMQVTEALLEARKFEAFSRMSAFVVHDLKNIVTQLSLMMKNAKRLGNNPEFQADMLLTVENSLERMRQLMLQLREGTAPGDASVGVDLCALARSLGESVARRGRRLEVQEQGRVAARGHPERLERVLGHLVNNALEATEPPQRVWIEVDRFGSHARVVVGDEGAGMPEAFVRDRLFKPFQTTKSSGMGIGAYESFQYVQELGGKMSVDSAPGQGTRITLLLPLIESFENSDLHPMGET